MYVAGTFKYVQLTYFCSRHFTISHDYSHSVFSKHHRHVYISTPFVKDALTYKQLVIQCASKHNRQAISVSHRIFMIFRYIIKRFLVKVFYCILRESRHFQNLSQQLLQTDFTTFSKCVLYDTDSCRGNYRLFLLIAYVYSSTVCTIFFLQVSYSRIYLFTKLRLHSIFTITTILRSYLTPACMPFLSIPLYTNVA